MTVIYAPRALRDLRGIADYLGERSPSGTKRVFAAIKSSIDDLEMFPGLGAAVDEKGHRRLPIVSVPYAIYYRLAGGEVIVLHIRHTSRKPVDPASDL